MISSTVLVLCLSAMAFAASVPNEPIPITHQESEVEFDGHFKNSYETGNGIVYQESGVLKNAGQKDKEAQEIKGSVSYTAPDGTKVNLAWVADEYGAQFKGSHVPTPPPVPELPESVQRALQYIQTHSTTEKPHGNKY